MAERIRVKIKQVPVVPIVPSTQEQITIEIKAGTALYELYQVISAIPGGGYKLTEDTTLVFKEVFRG